MPVVDSKIVKSEIWSLSQILSERYTIDFYQREYVWQRKQIEDLLSDLSTEFLKNWRKEHSTAEVKSYDPYFMGEIVLSASEESVNAIIDGQQRITTMTLLLIFLKHRFGGVKKFPSLDSYIYRDDFGTPRFVLDIDERRECMTALFDYGVYDPKHNDTESVVNIVARYQDFEECWNEAIDDSNAAHFAYWLINGIKFSRVWTNSSEFAYVIFETMNDRGLSLTQVEMLRSYLLANIDAGQRDNAMRVFDGSVSRLSAIKLSSRSKAEFDFFKLFLRGHYADSLSQSPTSNSDFMRIGKEFHRWVRDNSAGSQLNLNSSDDFVDFIDRIDYFSRQYELIHQLINKRNTKEDLYLVVNADYGFTLQPALILSAISYQDTPEVVKKKIHIVSRYLTKVLSWRVWNHAMISQSALESHIYEACKKERGLDVDELQVLLDSGPIEIPGLGGVPHLNRMNKPKLRVLIALITEIVARESGEPHYMLNDRDIEVEHIWANHFERHTDEFASEDQFTVVRNSIGDLLVLPKSFNASYGDMEYEDKVKYYFGQNILAQSLYSAKYSNAPGFMQFLAASQLPFTSYDVFDAKAVSERSDLYRKILTWNWSR